MPLFMDIHYHVEGLTADAVAGAHDADLKTQEKYGVKYLRYWFEKHSRPAAPPVAAARPSPP